MDIGRFAILSPVGTAAEAIQTHIEETIGKKLPIHKKRGVGYHYITLEMLPTATGTFEIKLVDGDLVLLCDWANYTDAVSYFTKHYFQSFGTGKISVSSADDKRMTVKELWAALNKEIPEHKGDKTQMIRIDCYGDSVTQGVGLNGETTAEYGKSTYPSWLTTMLTDKGYNVSIKNHGHAGECYAEVAVRCGAMTCYTTEDIVLPKSSGIVSLGARSFPCPTYKVIGTKLYIPKDKYALSTDQYVHFLDTGRETNPVEIGDYTCEITGVPGKDPYYEKGLRTKFKYTEDQLVVANTPLTLANKADADINIIYAGFNDQGNLTLSDFISFSKHCANVNKDGYIILGCSLPIWRTHNWGEMTGTKEQMDLQYKQACYDAFGYHFIDLYEKFANRGLDIALELGLFADKTDVELADIRTKLENHEIPAEFSQNGKGGDIHLSKEGCAVVAALVAERLEMLGYIGE